ncbi:MAG: hypothetical protein LKK19_05535 [Bacteroidales bacterium]|jgi:hypothetical protein|nr:hypothetical protein [Bacteroidales bacterium]MCI2122146.1 hypothetical protein [Bacteroidales bacterium]MCI2146173.1 hypothetical protein [Bacteroidales bacterium]
MFKKIGEWYRKQSDFVKVSIWIGILLIIGIIIRWNYVKDGIMKGINFYNK